MSRPVDLEVHEQAYEERIIDLDFHLHIPHAKLLDYVEDPFLREKIEARGTPPSSPRTLHTNYSRNKGTRDSHDRVHGIAANTAEIRDISDRLAIDLPLVQAGTNLSLRRNNYPEVSKALVRAYNSYVVDRVVDVDEEVYASAFIPEWDVDLALEELDRVGREPGIAAAQGWLTTYKLWGDVEYDPIFEKLVELDLNLILHVTTGMNMWDTEMSESNRSVAEYHVVRYGHAALANAANMIISGVFDDFPDLLVSIQEAGTDWLPYLAYTLDERYVAYGRDVDLVERLYRKGKRSLDRMPSEYAFDNLRVATQPTGYPNVPRTDHVEALLTACRAEQTFQYTSDWPHLTLDPVEWVYDTPCIDADLRRRILYENSAEFLRL